MTDKKVEQETVAKAISALRELSKGHSSGPTNATKVETMVGESGSTQIFHTASNSDPKSWAGSTWTAEQWDDFISSNGTDLESVRKMAKSIVDKLAKGQALTANELGFVTKGGLNFLKKDDEDKEKAEKAFPPKKEEEVEKGHSDEAEDKKLVKEMVKPGAMNKSFGDLASEEPAVRQGFEVSEFLAGFGAVMGKSLAAMEARLMNAIASEARESTDMSKSLAEALANLGDVLSAHAQRLEQIEVAPARAPKSLTKGGDVAPRAEGGESLTKSQVEELMVDMVQKGLIDKRDVLKFNHTGEMTPETAAKVTKYRRG